jgi:hypothetical protein
MTGAYFSTSAVLARIDLLYPLAIEAADATQDAADTRAYVTVMNEKRLTAVLKQLTRQLVGERAPMLFIASWRPISGKMGINLRILALFSTFWKSSWTPPRESILMNLAPRSSMGRSRSGTFWARRKISRQQQSKPYCRSCHKRSSKTTGRVG